VLKPVAFKLMQMLCFEIAKKILAWKNPTLENPTLENPILKNSKFLSTWITSCNFRLNLMMNEQQKQQQQFPPVSYVVVAYVAFVDRENTLQLLVKVSNSALFFYGYFFVITN